MKRLINLCLIFAVTTAILSGCSSNQQSTAVSQDQPVAQATQSKDASATEEPSAKKDLSIKITPPEGWKPVAGSVLPVQYMKNTASFMVKEERFKGDTLDEVVKEALAAFEAAFDNVNLQGAAVDLTVSGYDAKKITFTCVVSKMNMKYTYVYLSAEGRVYAITFGDLADSFDALSADYATILTDIRFE